MPRKVLPRAKPHAEGRKCLRFPAASNTQSSVEHVNKTPARIYTHHTHSTSHMHKVTDTHTGPRLHMNNGTLPIHFNVEDINLSKENMNNQKTSQGHKTRKLEKIKSVKSEATCWLIRGYYSHNVVSLSSIYIYFFSYFFAIMW